MGYLQAIATQTCEGPTKIKIIEWSLRPKKEMGHKDEVSTQKNNAKIAGRIAEVIEEVREEPVYWYEDWDEDW